MSILHQVRQCYVITSCHKLYNCHMTGQMSDQLMSFIMQVHVTVKGIWDLYIIHCVLYSMYILSDQMCVHITHSEEMLNSVCYIIETGYGTYYICQPIIQV